ncbi:TIGR00730 family Rossman fold protein [Paenibacillus macerans]|uniref:LOG family protein n=1 Tax=Paenibacillus macerans TaxID=44252 RepID=UPI00203DAE79|nr:TIGR00730 family Rossman fold protein [Paenibacillus macerans]MCM3700498.1 TIGR00730 family Rossman fold protein [Paenibacillus macerans]
MKTICVYAGSRFGKDERYRGAAEQLGRYLAEHGFRLVYGGSKHGLMGTVADAALAGGGEVVGVMPTGLLHGEAAHPGLTEFIEVKDMHARKAKMSELADGFIALPGGFGTLEELFEALCWLQIGIHRKPIGVLSAAGYYDPLLGLVKSCIDAGFVDEGHLSLINMADDPGELITRMKNFVPAIAETKWRQEK